MSVLPLHTDPIGKLHVNICRQIYRSVQVNVSVWTLVAICMDRYQAIIHPLAKKQSKKTAR